MHCKQRRTLSEFSTSCFLLGFTRSNHQNKHVPSHRLQKTASVSSESVPGKNRNATQCRSSQWPLCKSAAQSLSSAGNPHDRYINEHGRCDCATASAASPTSGARLGGAGLSISGGRHKASSSADSKPLRGGSTTTTSVPVRNSSGADPAAATRKVSRASAAIRRAAARKGASHCGLISTKRTERHRPDAASDRPAIRVRVRA